MKYQNILVTGGRGFIGSHFVELCLENGHKVIDIDSMTYASSKSLPWDNHQNYTLIQQDICDITHIPMCDIIVNFAAESHVDNSIESPKKFFESNTRGVFNILELIKNKAYNRPLFLHVSTDEVYGDIRNENFSEMDKLLPGNPYSASKAAAEMFIFAYGKTYNLDYMITRSSNNYGERQYYEKLIPQIIYCLKNNRKIPIHGDGSYVRDWIYVKDNVSGIYEVMNKGKIGEIYNISANNHYTNLEIVEIISKWFGIEDYMSNVDFVPNRIGQDLRYSIDSSKLKNIGWQIKYNKGIHKYI